MKLLFAAPYDTTAYTLPRYESYVSYVQWIDVPRPFFDSLSQPLIYGARAAK